MYGRDLSRSEYIVEWGMVVIYHVPNKYKWPGGL